MEEGQPKPSQRQAQADARREQLLLAARVLFAERGVRATTVREIARAVGVTEGVLYHYFPSKSALARAVVDRFHPGPSMKRLMESQEGVPIEEALFRIGIGYLDMLSKNRDFVLMVLREAPRDPEVAQLFGGYLLQVFQAGVRLMEGRVAAGELRPHDVTCSLRTFMGSLFGAFMMRTSLSPPLPGLDNEPYVRSVVDVVLRGVGAPREGEERP